MDDFANIISKLDCPHEVIGPCLLINSDCLDVLPTLAAGSVDAVVTDPPYGVGLTARVTKHTKRTASKNYADDERFVEQQIIPRVRAWLEIAKVGAVTPGNRMLQRYPNANDIGGVFYPNGAGRGPWGFTCFNPVLFYGKCPFLARGKGSRPTAVLATHWFSDDVDHPCPKPVEFMQWMVERASWEGETVADPFMGSGTTGVACIRTGRRFIGIELDHGYYRIACDRIRGEWETFQGGPMFAPKADNPGLFAETDGAKLKPAS